MKPAHTILAPLDRHFLFSTRIRPILTPEERHVGIFGQAPILSPLIRLSARRLVFGSESVRGCDGGAVTTHSLARCHVVRGRGSSHSTCIRVNRRVLAGRDRFEGGGEGGCKNFAVIFCSTTMNALPWGNSAAALKPCDSTSIRHPPTHRSAACRCDTRGLFQAIRSVKAYKV